MATVANVTWLKSKKSDLHTHVVAQIEGSHVGDRVGAMPGPDSVNRRISGPGSLEVGHM